MAILSVSRKTDIPTFYSEWFLNRLEAKEFYIRNNPFNPRAVSHITFEKEDIDCIVFWTKNPIPMMDKLNRLNTIGYPYYFQFTLNGYGRDLELGLPDKLNLIEAFQQLSIKTNGNVVWRYDPIIIDEKYTMNWHLITFAAIAQKLNGYTNRCVVSFVDLYKYVEQNLTSTGRKVEDVSVLQTRNDFKAFCQKLADIAHSHNMRIFTCAEEIDLDDIGIEHGACIDKDLIEQIIGYPIKANKDSGQRNSCLCAESIDVGKYNTCHNGCRYCYACRHIVEAQPLIRYNVKSPILCDKITKFDEITEKRLHTLNIDHNNPSLF